MNKTAIKNFAMWARTRLIEDIKYKASLLGITEKGVANPLPQSTSAEQYYDIGTKEPNMITGKQITQRRSLAEAINNKAKEVDYKVAYNSIMEAVAYTWFNRLIAVRFMEVNDYLPCKIRVLSAEDGRQEPDIVRMPMDARLDYSDVEANLIRNYQLNNASDELFQMLFIKVCNDLSSVLPQLFEKQDDYTELLFNISYTNQDGLVYKLVHDIPQEDFDIEQGGQVEIIGWLYQYYNTEPKNETFALLKKNVKITKERIPSATQLFTPDWIVRYMVENSLGRLWVEGHPNDFLKSNWKYYLEEVEQEADVKAKLDEIRKEYAKLNPEDIKVIDPCMGSGHILVYAFDVLMQIYLSVGYSEKDAAISILENNLYGLDIDDRAFQLAYFAVLMKARQYHKLILKKQVQHHIYAIVESNGIKISQLQYFGAALDELSKNVALPQMQGLIDQLKDAKEYGSILTISDFDWKLLRQFVADFDITQEPDLFATFGVEVTQQRLQQLIDVGESLAQKYEVVVTNPPYMGAGGMGKELADFIKEEYPDSKSDLFAVFMEVCNFLAKVNGKVSLVTMNAWMFLTSYEQMRKKILRTCTLQSINHLGMEAFDGVIGKVVQTVAYNLHKGFIKNFKGISTKLTAFYDSKRWLKETEFFNPVNRYTYKQDDFIKIPGSPIAYWWNDSIYKCFNEKRFLSGNPMKGIQTGNGEKYLRFWFEPGFNNLGLKFKNYNDLKNSNLRWFPLTSGGAFRKWYGNFEMVANLKNGGTDIRATGLKNFRLKEPKYYFQEGVTWTEVTTKGFNCRYLPSDILFGNGGPVIFELKEELFFILGLLNSAVAKELFDVLAPTINFGPEQVRNIPLKVEHEDACKALVKENICISKKDWDVFETSWDFKKHPLI